MKESEFIEMYGRYLDTSSIKHKKLNLRYGPYERNLLDIYYPDDECMKYPLILFIQGGGFLKGEKGRYQLKPALKGLKRGYAVANMNYRTIQEDNLPAAGYDIKCAIRYLKHNHDELKINPEYIVVWGESAGATLAVFAGLTANTKATDLSMGYEEENESVLAVIDWYGPVNIKKMELDQRKANTLKKYDNRSLNLMWFDKENKKSEVEIFKEMEDFCSLNYLSKESMVPPFFILHGLADDVIPISQSIQLKDVLTEYLDKENLIFKPIENGKHGVEGYQSEELINEIMDFIKHAIDRKEHAMNN